MYLDQLKGILNRYPDSMECFIINNKLICRETTTLAKSELTIDIPVCLHEDNEHV
jgi:hypothetical protein